MKYVLALGALTACGALVWLYATHDGFASYISEERLNYARDLAENEPLMALAGTEPEKLRDAITSLEDVQRELSKRQQDQGSAELVATALYPTHFLRAIADLEEKRRRFLQSGSRDDLRSYDEEGSRTVEAYRRDLAAFQSAYEELVPEDVKDYAATGVLVSRKAAENALGTLTLGIEETDDALKKRRACIRGLTFLCEEVNEQRTNADAFAPQVVTEEERLLAEEVRSAYERAGRDLSPTIEMQKGACTASLPGAGFFALQADTGMPTYLGDLRLVESGARASVPFYEYFASREVGLVPAPTFSAYACPEFAAELSQLLGLIALQGTAPEAQERLALQLKNNSTEFDKVVRYVALLEEIILRANDNGAPAAFDAATLFHVRSAFLALFLTHNPSVTGVHGPFFLQNSIPVQDQPFIFYSSLPSSARASVIDGIRAFDEVHGARL